MKSRARPWQLVLVAALGLLYLLPLVWMVLTSFKSDAAVRTAPNELFFSPTLDTFRDILGAGSASVVTSFQIAVAVTVLVVAIAVPAAYAVGQRVTRGWVDPGLVRPGRSSSCSRWCRSQWQSSRSSGSSRAGT